MRFDPTTAATFVAGVRGRDAHLALWQPPSDDKPPPDGPSSGGPSPDDALDDGQAAGGGALAGGETRTLVLADGPVDVRVDRVPIGAAIGPLASLAATGEVTDSVRALSVAVRLTLDLISRGRVLPAAASDGTDQWRVGPLDAADRARLSQLADALPATVLAAPIGSTSDERFDRLADPHETVAAFVDAVADAFVRTAGAEAATGYRAFAADEPTDVTVAETWLQSVVAGTAGETTVGLRMQMPEDLDDPVRCVLQIQSRVDPSLVLDAEELWTAPAAVRRRFGTDVETDLLLTLRRASRVWPPAKRLLEETTPTELELFDGEVEDLFGSTADDLAAAGLPVLWPATTFQPLTLRPVVSTEQPEGGGTGALDMSSLGELRWTALLDGDDLDESELRELAQAKRPVVRLRGQWVRADPTRLRRLHERTPVPVGDVLAAALTGTLRVAGEEVDAELDGPLLDLAERLVDVESIQALPAPPGVDATLRPYQERGLAWLAEMAALGLGGVLADDMGLGKTIQLLSLHVHRTNAGSGVHGRKGPTLVVCPATLMGNWEREAARFAPGVTVHRYHGTGRSLDGVGPDDLVVATYGIARRDHDALDAVGWDLVVCDEAQAIKNPLSRTAKALRRIRSHARIALTGTPVENRLTDLWALLDWTTPGLLGDLTSFQRFVATPIEREQDEALTARLAQIVRPFLLRRRKSDPDIAPDLPPKTETDRVVALTVEQATLYKATVDELFDDVREADGFDRRGLVLKLLTALKQICNHPAQYLNQDGPLPGRSGKLEAAGDLLSVIVDEGDSAIVFTQYVAMGHLLGAHLTSLGIESRFLHGSVPVGSRQQMVDDFQAGEFPVFVVSLKAGGTGLNLTRATHVVHYDRWWNPAVEDQASDRAWRIGQDRPVQVHRMVTEGTLEDRIGKLLEAKRALADAVVGGGEAWVSELSNDELAELVSLGDGF